MFLLTRSRRNSLAILHWPCQAQLHLHQRMAINLPKNPYQPCESVLSCTRLSNPRHLLPQTWQICQFLHQPLSPAFLCLSDLSIVQVLPGFSVMFLHNETFILGKICILSLLYFICLVECNQLGSIKKTFAGKYEQRIQARC